MIFTIFGHNTAEFYDYYSLLTMISLFLSEFWLKSRNLRLHLTENGKTLPPPPPPQIQVLLPTVALYPNVQLTLLIGPCI